MATSTQSAPIAPPIDLTEVKRKPDSLRNNLFFLGMLFFTAVWLIPIIGALITSIRTQGDITAHGYWSIPSELTLENFGQAWVQGQVSKYLANSFIIAIPALIFTLFLSSLGAYALARFKFKGNLIIYFMFVAGTLLPFQILLLPVFYMQKTIGLYNQYSGLILIHTAFQLGFCTFVLRNFMRTIPGEIFEAARMDGAGEFRCYWNIMIPLSLSALAALATLEFTWIFNDYIWALILISDGSKQPITTGLSMLQGQYNTNWPVLTSGAMIGAIPTVIVFILLQRYFIQGLTLGSGK